MERRECTAEALKSLGYEARTAYTSWNNCSDKLAGAQADEIFEEIAKAARNGGKVEITRNILLHQVIATLPQMRHEYRGMTIIHYIARPMTEAEQLEANMEYGLK